MVYDLSQIHVSSSVSLPSSSPIYCFICLKEEAKISPQHREVPLKSPVIFSASSPHFLLWIPLTAKFNFSGHMSSVLLQPDQETPTFSQISNISLSKDLVLLILSYIYAFIMKLWVPRDKYNGMFISASNTVCYVVLLKIYFINYYKYYRFGLLFQPIIFLKYNEYFFPMYRVSLCHQKKYLRIWKDICQAVEKLGKELFGHIMFRARYANIIVWI